MLSVRIDDAMEEGLNKLAAQEQGESGEKISVSDVVRSLIRRKLNEEAMLASRPSSPHIVPLKDDYDFVSRKLLKAKEIRRNDRNQVLLREVSVKSWVLTRNSSIPSDLVQPESLTRIPMLPSFTLATNPQWSMIEFEEDLAYEVEEAAKWSIQYLEDVQACALIGDAVPEEHECDCVSDAFGVLRDHLIEPVNILHHPHDELLIPDRKLDEFDVDIHLSTICPRGEVFVLGDNNLVGVIEVLRPLTVIEANEPTRLLFGRVVFESVGMAVVNDYAISRVKFDKDAGVVRW